MGNDILDSLYKMRFEFDQHSEMPETQVSTALILAQRVMDLFDQAGATPQEQDTALSLAKTLVLDRLYRDPISPA